MKTRKLYTEESVEVSNGGGCCGSVPEAKESVQASSNCGPTSTVDQKPEANSVGCCG